MKASRFSMTLYISLPVLASACSIVMIAHFVMLVEGRIQEDGLYGDMFAYIALAETLHFFSSEIISFRVLAPLISGSIATLFGLSGEESVGLLTGSLNFLYLLAGFGCMFYLSIKEQTINSLEVAAPAFLILTLPGFWQGVFLPVPDAMTFGMFGLILIGVLNQRLVIFIPSMLAGVFISEWMFMAALLLPLTDYLRGKIWARGYVTIVLIAVVFLIIPLLTQIPEAHLVYQPGQWFDGIREQLSSRDTSLIWSFWRSFTLTLLFFAYRFYLTGWNRVTGSLAFWFGLIFILAFVLAPDSANRIMFMMMPALVLWQYHPDTFLSMDKPIANLRTDT